jgi:hypothetical protein
MKKLFLIALVMLAVPSFAQAAKLTPGYVIKFDGGIYTADSSIYNNGVNVGIGSTVPRAKLEVVGTVRATTFIGDASGMTGLPSTSQWTTNGTSIGTTGNVGVGSSAPSQKVDVIGTVKATAFVGDGTGITGLSGSISGLTSGKLPKATSATTIGDGQIYDNGTNVGVGSTVPRSKLDIGAGTVTAGAFVGDGTGITGLSGSISGLTPGYYSKSLTSTSIGNAVIYDNGTNVGLGSTAPRGKLDVNGSIYGNNLILTDNGNSGIGTTLPSQALEVIGTVKATAFVGDGTGITGLSGSISGLTSGKLPKATSATTIGDGQIYDNGTNIGIGTTVPIAKLSVAGDLYLNGGAYIYGTGSGNIGIGSLTPAAALDISGAGSKIRMLSPDSSIYNCGPANGGTWTCS